MALTKQIDFKNGITTENAYIEISNISIDYDNQTTNFNVKTYLNKETKELGLNPIETEYLHVSDNMLTPYQIDEVVVKTTPWTQYFKDGDVLVNGYKYLLTLDKYKDSVIVE